MNRIKTLLLIAVALIILVLLVYPAVGSPELAGISEVKQQLIKVDSDEFSKKINTDNVVILDIRTPEEYASGHLENAINIDFYAADFSAKLQQLNKETTYMVYCRSGNRSSSAFKQMEQLGFKSIYELNGGINSWIKYGNSVCKNC